MWIDHVTYDDTLPETFVAIRTNMLLNDEYIAIETPQNMNIIENTNFLLSKWANGIDDVMVIVVALGSIYCGFETRSGQTKDSKIVICGIPAYQQH